MLVIPQLDLFKKYIFVNLSKTIKFSKICRIKAFIKPLCNKDYNSLST